VAGDDDFLTSTNTLEEFPEPGLGFERGDGGHERVSRNRPDVDQFTFCPSPWQRCHAGPVVPPARDRNGVGQGVGIGIDLDTLRNAVETPSGEFPDDGEALGPRR
jgi:hypothetical protein